MKKALTLFVLLIVYLFYFSSCKQVPKNDNTNSSSVDDTSDIFPAPTDSVGAEPGRNPASVDTIPATVGIEEPPSQPLPAKGSLAFFCPRKMLEGSANVITATISVADFKQALETIKAKAAASDNTLDAKAIKEGAEAHTINLSQKMKIELKYSTDDFIVISKPEIDEQTFTDKDMLEWNWCVEPTHIGDAQIYLSVKGYDEASKSWIAAQEPALYKIKIEIDKRTYFAKLWEFLKIHPEWLFVQVLFPIIGFAVGRKTKK